MTFFYKFLSVILAIFIFLVKCLCTLIESFNSRKCLKNVSTVETVNFPPKQLSSIFPFVFFCFVLEMY